MSAPWNSHAAPGFAFTSFILPETAPASNEVVVKAQGLGDPTLPSSNTFAPSPPSSASFAFLPSFDRILGTLENLGIPTTTTTDPGTTSDVTTPSTGNDQQQQQTADTVVAAPPSSNTDANPVVSFPAAPDASSAPIPASSIVDGTANLMPAASTPPSQPAPAPAPTPAPAPAPTPAPAPAPPATAQPTSIVLDTPSAPIAATVQAAPEQQNVVVTNPVDAPTPPPPAPSKVEEKPASTDTTQPTRPPLSKPVSTPAPPSSRLFSPSAPSSNYMDTPDNGGVLSNSSTRSTSSGGMSAYGYAGIVLAGVVAGVILLVFARKMNRRRKEREEVQGEVIFDESKHSHANEPSQEEMLTMTAIMQEATPKPSRIGSQRTSLMAWAKGGRRKKERFEDLVSTFEPESVVVQTTPIQHGAYPQQPQHRLSAVYEDGDSEDEDEEAIRTVPQDSGRQGAYVSAKLTAMMSSKSSRQKYAGTVNRRYSQVPEQGQVAKMMGQTKQSKRTSLPPSSNVINLGGNKLPKLAPAPKEYTSANALDQIVNENRMRAQKPVAPSGAFASFAARPTSVYASLENVSSPTPKHRWSLATSLEEAADRMVKTHSSDSSPALSIKMPIAKYGVSIGKKMDATVSQESLVSSIDIPPAVTAHSSAHSLSNMLRAQASRISLPETVDSSSHASDEGHSMPTVASSGHVHASVNAMQAAIGGSIPSNRLVAPAAKYAPSEAGESVSNGSDGFDFDIRRMQRAESPASSGHHLWSSRNGLVE